jgi:hypothetical protein
MKKHDFIFLFITISLILLLTVPVTSEAFFSFTARYTLIGGFIKFFVFATYGDLLSHRIRSNNYLVKGLFFKALVWGFIGIVITYIFNIFPTGVTYLQSMNLLPFHEVALFNALFISLFMNLTFAPTMMLFHRITDHYIEHKVDNNAHQLSQSIGAVDYKFFIDFVVLKTIPFFWIPAHTLTFLLPNQYRVFFASLLGIMLGLILGLSKPKKKELV